MRCANCKKKGIPLTCKFCSNSFCTSCIQLEIHNCNGINVKRTEELKNLEETLKFEPPRKLDSI